MEQTYKSPRKVEEEIKEYKRKRFEDYMVLVDEGKMERGLAIAALQDEMDHIDTLGENDET